MRYQVRKGGLVMSGLVMSLAAQAQTDAPAKPFRYDTLAMILALLALIGVVLIWTQVRQLAQKTATGQRPANTGVNPVGELSTRVSSLEDQVRRLTNQLKTLESELRQVRDRNTVRNEPRQQPASAAPTPPPVAEPRPTAQSATVAVNRPAESVPPSTRSGSSQTQRAAPVNSPPTKLYARTVDVPGGFSVGSLVETPNRPMVFVITMTGPGQATFRVTDDPEAQRLALSDPYSYLSDACNYQSRPEVNSRIHMITDGQLQLQGEKWQIIEKAEISFYA